MLKPVSLPAIAALALSGCADPRGSYDDFRDQVLDAASRADAPPLGAIPDVTGQFYLALRPAATPTLLFRYVADVVLEQGPSGPTIDVTLVALDRDTLEPVGDPGSVEDVPISDSGEFTIMVDDAIIPARANPVTGEELIADTVFLGVLRTEDLFCGDVEGMVTSPVQLSLDGSTFGAIRIEPGTTGTDLPEPLAECPATGEADAGVPDAGPADAGPADAGAADAGPADAGADAALPDAG